MFVFPGDKQTNRLTKKPPAEAEIRFRLVPFWLMQDSHAGG